MRSNSIGGSQNAKSFHCIYLYSVCTLSRSDRFYFQNDNTDNKHIASVTLLSHEGRTVRHSKTVKYYFNGHVPQNYP